MIRYIKHIDINKQRWDQCITKSYNGLVYALSWYLDVVSPNWDALILDDYIAVMPLTKKKKFGLNYLVQPPFSQQLGVFCLNDSYDLIDFLQAIPAKFLHTRICLNSGNSLQSSKSRLSYCANYRMLLDKPYDAIFNSFSQSHKRNIKKARKQKLKVIRDNDLNTFLHFYNKFHSEVVLMSDFELKILDKLMSRAQEQKSLVLHMAQNKQGEITSSLVFLKFRDTYTMLISLSNRQGKESRAVFLLLDSFLNQHAESSAVLDFEGSNIEGVSRFFKGFGGINKPYLYLQSSRIPFI